MTESGTELHRSRSEEECHGGKEAVTVPKNPRDLARPDQRGATLGPVLIVALVGIREMDVVIEIIRDDRSDHLIDTGAREGMTA